MVRAQQSAWFGLDLPWWSGLLMVLPALFLTGPTLDATLADPSTG